MFNPYWRHFKVISKHKFIVMMECIKCGQVWRGINHDNSKFGFTEFVASARNFQGTRSPIDAEKEKYGYSIAWQHHKGHNPHHWEYWIDNVGERKNDPVPMPYRYIIEMVCDWVGAGKVYSKEKWTPQEPAKYYQKMKSKRIIHPDTMKIVEYLLATISASGLEEFHRIARHPKDWVADILVR